MMWLNGWLNIVCIQHKTRYPIDSKVSEVPQSGDSHISTNVYINLVGILSQTLCTHTLRREMHMSKYKQVKVNFTIDDHIKISNLAIRENKTIAQLIRSRFTFEIENTPIPKQVVTYKQTDPKLLYEIRKIGNNINQAVKKLHRGQMLEKRILIKIYEKVSQL